MTLFYIRKLFRKFQIYIIHCSQCQLNKIIKYSFYDSLRPIQNFAISFHIIIMNFIFALFIIQQKKFDTILTMTCKFIKRIIFIFDKSTWSIDEWTSAFLTILLKHDWNISKITICDRNRKFMSDFWRNIFKKLNIEILVSIVYHSQTNEQFKRIN